MALEMSVFTENELKILEVLSDGAGHSASEIIERVDPYMEVNALKQAIHRMKPKMRPHAHDIISQAYGSGMRMVYRHVRLLKAEGEQSERPGSIIDRQPK